MVRGHHTASDPPRQFPVGSATRTTHRQLHHPLERKRGAVHVDRDSKGYYRQGTDHRARLSEAAGQQPEPEIKNIILSDTRFAHGPAVSIGHGDTMLRDQLIDDLDWFSPVQRLAWS